MDPCGTVKLKVPLPYKVTTNAKFANKEWKGVNLEKIKVFPLARSKYLSSWTGLGRSGHVRFQTVGQISHVSALLSNTSVVMSTSSLSD